MAAARLIAVCFACFTLAACGGEAPAPTGTYDFDPEQGTVTASAPGDAGETTMLSGPEIAAPLPVDISILPGAEVTSATHVTAPNGLRIALVEMVTEQSPAEVAEYYRTATAIAGLASALDLAGPDGVTFIAIGGHRQRMTLHAAPARIAPDGSRAPVSLVDQEANNTSDESDAQPVYRDMTAVQLYIIGNSEPVSSEAAEAP